MTNANPGPWVDPEFVEEEPWRTHNGIVKFFEFAVPIKEMSPRAFHLYWQKHHSPNVMNITAFAQFMRKYNSSHTFPEKIDGLPDHYHQNTPFQGAAEVWVNSIQEVGDWLGHPTYAELIQPDEPRFISQDGEVEIIITKEERLFEPVVDMVESLKIKTYLLTTGKRGDVYDSIHAAASAHGKLILDHASLKRHLDKFVISHKLREPLPLEGFELDDIDTVFEFWFEDIAAMQSFFAEPDYAQKIVPEEQHAFDASNIRSIVTRMRVVHDEFSFQPSTTQPMPFHW